MSFYKKPCPEASGTHQGSETARTRRHEGSSGREPDPVATVGRGSAAGQGIRTGMRRFDRRQIRDQLFSARRAAALVRHQHVPKNPLPGRRTQSRRVRRSLCRRAVRHRHYVPRRYALRPARNPPHLVLVHHLQFRNGRGSSRIAQDVRRWRYLLPGQHHQESRPDHQGRRAYPVARNASDDHGRRPLHRLPLRARRRAIH